MTTHTEATQDTGADVNEDQTREPTARELAMEAIADHRESTFEAESKGEQAPTAPAKDDDAQLAAQLESKPADFGKTLVRVKIDGIESEVSIEEMQRQYQKNGAAERRLEEATRLLNEARMQNPPKGVDAQARTGDSPPNPRADAPSDAGQEGREFLAALFEGDEDKALMALQKLGLGRQQPTFDPTQLAAQLTPAIKQQLTVDSALDRFKVDYADIVADPYLANLADQYLDSAVNSGLPFTEALEDAGKKTRDWLTSKGVTTPPKPSPTTDRTTKLERKQGIDKIPSLNTKAMTNEQPEQSATDVINEMRRNRGLEVL